MPTSALAVHPIGVTTCSPRRRETPTRRAALLIFRKRKGLGLPSSCEDCHAGRLDIDSNPTEMYTYQLRVAIVGVSRDSDAAMKIITIPVGAVLMIATITLGAGAHTAHPARVNNSCRAES